MARSIFDDLMPWAVYGGIGYVLLRRGPTGESLLDGLVKGISASAIHLPAAPPVTSAQSPDSGTADGPANSGPSKFNFNDLETNAEYSENTGMLKAHAGFGHVGSGGTYQLTLDVHNTGFGGLFGLGTQWLSADRAQLQINDDADWTGYGYDFLVHVDRVLFTGLETRLQLLTATGALIQSKVVGASFGF